MDEWKSTSPMILKIWSENLKHIIQLKWYCNNIYYLATILSLLACWTSEVVQLGRSDPKIYFSLMTYFWYLMFYYLAASPITQLKELPTLVISAPHWESREPSVKTSPLATPIQWNSPWVLYSSKYLAKLGNSGVGQILVVNGTGELIAFHACGNQGSDWASILPLFQIGSFLKTFFRQAKYILWKIFSYDFLGLSIYLHLKNTSKYLFYKFGILASNYFTFEKYSQVFI